MWFMAATRWYHQKKSHKIGSCFSLNRNPGEGGGGGGGGGLFVWLAVFVLFCFVCFVFF